MGVKKIFSNRIEKLHKMAFIIYIFFLKKFEKVEKTGIIFTKVSLRCTPSVILGRSIMDQYFGGLMKNTPGEILPSLQIIKETCETIRISFEVL